jgi:hypothetical protein
VFVEFPSWSSSERNIYLPEGGSSDLLQKICFYDHCELCLKKIWWHLIKLWKWFAAPSAFCHPQSHSVFFCHSHQHSASNHRIWLPWWTLVISHTTNTDCIFLRLRDIENYCSLLPVQEVRKVDAVMFVFKYINTVTVSCVGIY